VEGVLRGHAVRKPYNPRGFVALEEIRRDIEAKEKDAAKGGATSKPELKRCRDGKKCKFGEKCKLYHPERLTKRGKENREHGTESKRRRFGKFNCTRCGSNQTHDTAKCRFLTNCANEADGKKSRD
jgi:hypothetical protein